MMFGIIIMGVIVIGCVFFFLYWAGNKQTEQLNQSGQQAVGDSLVIEVEDSALIETLVE